MGRTRGTPPAPLACWTAQRSGQIPLCRWRLQVHTQPSKQTWKEVLIQSKDRTGLVFACPACLPYGLLSGRPFFHGCVPSEGSPCTWDGVHVHALWRQCESEGDPSPGRTEFTRTPLGASLSARFLVRASMPALTAQYWGNDRMGTMAAMEDTLTMAPWATAHEP